MTRDPEMRTTPNGHNVTKFSVATNYVYKDKDGNKKETTEFHDCVVWGKGAELIQKWVTKGQEIYVCGRLQTNEWETQDGQKRRNKEIIVDEFQFGAKPKGHTEESGRTVGDALKDAEAPDGEIKIENLPF